MSLQNLECIVVQICTMCHTPCWIAIFQRSFKPNTVPTHVLSKLAWFHQLFR